MADRTIVMSGGQIVESNLTQTLFTAPQHPSAQKLIYAHNSMLKF
jgi:ABC-type dipeptide/oligopeptide/nickel transport system ATPase component